MADLTPIDPQSLAARLSAIAAERQQGDPSVHRLSIEIPHATGAQTPRKKRVGFSDGKSPSPPSMPASPRETPRLEFTLTDSYFPPVEDSEPSNPRGLIAHPPPFRLKKSALRPRPAQSPDHAEVDPNVGDDTKRQSTLLAQAKALKVAQSVGSYSAPGSRRNSFGALESKQRPEAETVPMQDLSRFRQAVESGCSERHNSIEEDDEEAERAGGGRSEYGRADRILNDLRRPRDFTYTPDRLQSGQVTPTEFMMDEETGIHRPERYNHSVLGMLLRSFAQQDPSRRGSRPFWDQSGHSSAQTSRASSPARSPGSSPPASGPSTPNITDPNRRRSFFASSRNHSNVSVAELIKQSSSLAGPGRSPFTDEDSARARSDREKRPQRAHKRSTSGSIYHNVKKQWKTLKDHEVRVKHHIEETQCRQRYLLKLCRALMLYGAPTHRLEDYMTYSAWALNVESSFLYLPGCMVVSFGDSSLGITEVKMVRTAQAVDLGKLADAHEVYKEVLHDKIGAAEGIRRLDELLKSKPKFGWKSLVFMYGLAAIAVGPFAFEARPIDFPMLFLLGSIVGFLQHWVAQRSEMFSNVFEVIAAVITSFLARALGSVNGGNTFCFSALSQSSIALILPGWIVLCASLELQSRSIIAGSIRMVYAIIYSLFLGYGITIGATLYGAMDPNATSAVSCQNPLKGDMSTWYKFFPFVPLFALCLALVNRAKWSQTPLMVGIAFVGYVVNYFADRLVPNTPQISNAFGAFAVGVIANVQARLGPRAYNYSLDLWETSRYSPRPFFVRMTARLSRRKRHADVEATPKGIADASTATDASPFDTPSRTPSSASTIPGDSETEYKDKPLRPTTASPPLASTHQRRIGYSLAAASMLPAIFVQVPSGLAVNGSLISGISLADSIKSNTTLSAAASSQSSALGDSSFAVAVNVVQVAIGITVGLFLSTLVVYFFGRRKRGLFSL